MTKSITTKLIEGTLIGTGSNQILEFTHPITGAEVQVWGEIYQHDRTSMEPIAFVHTVTDEDDNIIGEVYIKL